MTDIADKIIASKRRKAEDLEKSNQESYIGLQGVSDGKFGMDTSDLRRELLIENLVKWGVVSEDQVLDFEIEFHEKVEDALDSAWKSYREAKAEANKPKLSLPSTTRRPSLIGIDGKPLS